MNESILRSKIKQDSALNAEPRKLEGLHKALVTMRTLTKRLGIFIEIYVSFTSSNGIKSHYYN